MKSEREPERESEGESERERESESGVKVKVRGRGPFIFHFSPSLRCGAAARSVRMDAVSIAMISSQIAARWLIVFSGSQ